MAAATIENHPSVSQDPASFANCGVLPGEVEGEAFLFVPLIPAQAGIKNMPPAVIAPGLRCPGRERAV
jgi:hypothetical protein